MLLKVDYIEQDAIVSVNAYATQSNPPWGLSRISNGRADSDKYVYDESAGQGTCTYVIDTGIDDTHVVGPRTFPRHGEDEQTSIWHDLLTHGTGRISKVEPCKLHLSSRTSGMTSTAMKTQLFGIKVLADDGFGQWSSIIAGMDHVAKDAQYRSCPAGVLVNLSIGGPFSQAVNNAAADLVNRGFFVAVAAGNDNADASEYSPASEASVCTVGGTASDDTRYTMSNWGRMVDVMAPAVDVVSLWPGGRTRFTERR
ncbi:hypothetical protein CDD83_11113 [Cordyceps sp. RAO-2017]|nr:hypothetical protein CDD83_11113 [Cordyceps sp. RAO-2017]